MENRKPIRVFLRLRPPCENADGATTPKGEPLQYTLENSTTIAVENKQFLFSTVFDPRKNLTQHAFYEEVARPIVETFLEGRDGLIMAYGTTNSGKTYSISGPTPSEFNAHIGAQEGVLLRACEHIFWKTSDMFLASAFEIHRETATDLVGSGKIEMREDMMHAGIKEIEVRTNLEARSVFHRAIQKRQRGSTDANYTSSRSHAFFTLRHPITEARLCVVDLAGSERLKNTNASGERQKEGIQINLALTALRRCITSMRDNAVRGTSANHIPVRDSLVTFALARFLLNWQNPSPTSFIVCINPAEKTDSLHALDIGALQYHVARTKLVAPVVPKRVREEPEEPCERSYELIRGIRSSLNADWLAYCREISAKNHNSQILMMNKILFQETERQNYERKLTELIKYRETLENGERQMQENRRLWSAARMNQKKETARLAELRAKYAEESVKLESKLKKREDDELEAQKLWQQKEEQAQQEHAAVLLELNRLKDEQAQRQKTLEDMEHKRRQLAAEVGQHEAAVALKCDENQKTVEAKQLEQNEVLAQYGSEKNKLQKEMARLKQLLGESESQLEKNRKMREEEAAEWEKEKLLRVQYIEEMAAMEENRKKKDEEEREVRRCQIQMEEMKEDNARQARAAEVVAELERLQKEQAQQQKTLDELEKKREQFATEEQTYEKVKSEEWEEKRRAWDAEQSELSETLATYGYQKKQISEEVLRLKQLVLESEGELERNRKLREKEAADWEEERAGREKRREEMAKAELDWTKAEEEANEARQCRLQVEQEEEDARQARAATLTAELDQMQQERVELEKTLEKMEKRRDQLGTEEHANEKAEAAKWDEKRREWKAEELEHTAASAQRKKEYKQLSDEVLRIKQLVDDWKNELERNRKLKEKEAADWEEERTAREQEREEAANLEMERKRREEEECETQKHRLRVEQEKEAALQERTATLAAEFDRMQEKHRQLAKAVEEMEIIREQLKAEKQTSEKTKAAEWEEKRRVWVAEQSELSETLAQYASEKEKLRDEVLKLKEVINESESELERNRKLKEKEAAVWEEERATREQRREEMARAEVDWKKTEEQECKARKRRLQVEQEEEDARQAHVTGLMAELNQIEEERAQLEKAVQELEKKRELLTREEQAYEKAKVEEREEKQRAWDAEQSEWYETIAKYRAEKDKISEELLQLKLAATEEKCRFEQESKLNEHDSAEWEKERAAWKKQKEEWEKEKPAWEDGKRAHEQAMKEMQCARNQLEEEIESMRTQWEEGQQQWAEEDREWTEKQQLEWHEYEVWQEECRVERARWERLRVQFADERADCERRRNQLNDEIRDKMLVWDKEHKQRMAWEEEIAAKRLAREREEWDGKARSRLLEEEDARREDYLRKWEEDKRRAQDEVTRLEEMRARLTDEYAQLKRRYNVEAAAFEHERVSMTERRAAMKAQWHHEKLLHQQELHQLQQQQYVARTNLHQATQQNGAPGPSAPVNTELSEWPDLVRCTPKQIKLTSRSRGVVRASPLGSSRPPFLTPRSVAKNRMSSGGDLNFFSPREYDTRSEPGPGDAHSQGRMLNSPVQTLEFAPACSSTSVVTPASVQDAELIGQTADATTTPCIGRLANFHEATESGRHQNVPLALTLQDDVSQEPAIASTPVFLSHSLMPAATRSGQQLNLPPGTRAHDEVSQEPAIASTPVFLSHSPVPAATGSGQQLNLPPGTRAQDDVSQEPAIESTSVFLSHSPVPAATGSGQQLNLPPGTRAEDDVEPAIELTSVFLSHSPVPAAAGSGQQLNLPPGTRAQDDVSQEPAIESTSVFLSHSPVPAATESGQQLNLQPGTRAQDDESKGVDCAATPVSRLPVKEVSPDVAPLVHPARTEAERKSFMSLLSSASDKDRTPSPQKDKCAADAVMLHSGTPCGEKVSAGQPDCPTAFSPCPRPSLHLPNKVSPFSRSPRPRAFCPFLHTPSRNGASDNVRSPVSAPESARSPLRQNPWSRAVIDIRTPPTIFISSPSAPKSACVHNTRLSPAVQSALFTSSPKTSPPMGREPMDVDTGMPRNGDINSGAQSPPHTRILPVASPARQHGMSLTPPPSTARAVLDLTQSDTERSVPSQYPPARKHKPDILSRSFGRSEVSRNSRGSSSRKTASGSNSNQGNPKRTRLSLTKQQQHEQHMRQQRKLSDAEDERQKQFLQSRIRHTMSTSMVKKLMTRCGLPCGGKKEEMITRFLLHKDANHTPTELLELVEGSLQTTRSKTATSQPQQARENAYKGRLRNMNSDASVPFPFRGPFVPFDSPVVEKLR